MALIPQFARRLLLCLAVLALAACDSEAPKLTKLPANGLVLAFGDSLTFGTGTLADDSYPAVLQQLIGRPVIRAGVPGEVTAQGRVRLSALLSQHRPDLMILIHGGNDILRRLPRKDTVANLRDMILMAREKNIAVILIGVPDIGLLMRRSAGFYETVAGELEIPYDGETLPSILAAPALKSDAIHPNAKGYRKLAEGIVALLKKSGAI